MKVTTKKIQLQHKQFVKFALKNVMKEQWWVVLIFFAIVSMTFIIPSHWWWIGALIALVLYCLFWLIQFIGVAHLEQGKVFFEKLVYDITSKDIMVRKDAKQGMPVKWNMVKNVKEGNGYFLLKLSKVQFLYWPHKAFKNDNERKLVRHILKQKGLVN